MIIIYSLKDCGFCEELKKGLKKNNIEFTTKDIDNPKYGAEFNKLSVFAKSEMVPIMLIGKQVFAPDTSFKTIDECIELAKRFKA